MRRSDFFLGYGRVRLEDFRSDPSHSSGAHRSVNLKHAARLVDLFKAVGCDNVSEENAVLGIVDRVGLADALVAGGIPELPRAIGSSQTPLLHRVSVVCLQGLHRIEAARTMLDPADAWWTVKLYASGKLQRRLFSSSRRAWSGVSPAQLPTLTARQIFPPPSPTR